MQQSFLNKAFKEIIDSVENQENNMSFNIKQKLEMLKFSYEEIIRKLSLGGSGVVGGSSLRTGTPGPEGCTGEINTTNFTSS
jgi:hypothetical protein